MGRPSIILKRSADLVPPSIGLTVLSNLLVVVTLRDEPLRLTGIYRHDLSSAVDTRDAQDKLLRKALRHGRRSLRLRRGVAVTVALQPESSHIQMRTDEVTAESVAVRCRPPLPRLLNEAGFGTVSFDLLPASLARSALCRSRQSVSFQHQSGWRVRATSEQLEALWSTDVRIGDCAIEPLVPGAIDIPPELSALMRLGLDAGALGAALGNVGVGPLTGHAARQEVIDLRGARNSRPFAIA